MFQISTMANLETLFYELLTRPGAKHDEVFEGLSPP